MLRSVHGRVYGSHIQRLSDAAARRLRRNLPPLGHPHGGPWHATNGAKSEVQFLANAATRAAENFRGSTGFARKFGNTSSNQWGKRCRRHHRRRQDLKRKGHRPKGSRIYGGSFGAYATPRRASPVHAGIYALRHRLLSASSNLLTFLQHDSPPYGMLGFRGGATEVRDGRRSRAKDSRRAESGFAEWFLVDQIRRTPLLDRTGRARIPRVNVGRSTT
jgi:hypothetical protein